MAIKTSNQITFSEHKKITKIKEYYLATDENTGVTRETDGWTEDIKNIDYSKNYLWNYEEVVYSIGKSDLSDPVIISARGANGKGIKNIINYYQVTQQLTAPKIPEPNETSNWSEQASTATALSSINKYLWNYEAIVYTDGTVTNTDPALIGVYGDSGADAVTFGIYSPQGTVFKEDTTAIELKVAAFKGADSITDATYTWEWWNGKLNNGVGGYEVIVEKKENVTIKKENITDPTLIVNRSDEFAFSNLKCTMTYDGKIYEDYVALTDENIIYTSEVRFFNSINVLNADDKYLIAYINLYKNNDLIETIETDQCYYTQCVYNPDTKVIKTNVEGEFREGDKMYFVCTYRTKDFQDYPIIYQPILGQYTSDGWRGIDYSTKYRYQNDLYPDYPTRPNVIVISKEYINKSKDICFTVLKNSKQISSTHAIVIDNNDPIISAKSPENPANRQLWLDQSVSPAVLKIYSEEKQEWLLCAQQNGKAIYTSQPYKYKKDDLWILSDDETLQNKYDKFGYGSILKADKDSDTFNKDDWIDANIGGMTDLKINIEQYFNFDKNQGLKIGQKDENFYVQITSQRMSFYEVNDTKTAQEVVYISGNAATITNLTVEDNAEFKCNTKFNSEVKFFDFVWKKESNGSLSLAIQS